MYLGKAPRNRISSSTLSAHKLPHRARSVKMAAVKESLHPGVARYEEGDREPVDEVVRGCHVIRKCRQTQGSAPGDRY